MAHNNQHGLIRWVSAIAKYYAMHQQGESQSRIQQLHSISAIHRCNSNLHPETRDFSTYLAPLVYRGYNPLLNLSTTSKYVI